MKFFLFLFFPYYCTLKMYAVNFFYDLDSNNVIFQAKRKGVEGIIDIENPNRAAQASKKVTQVDLEGPRELSRRER